MKNIKTNYGNRKVKINEKEIPWSEYYAFPANTTKIPVVGKELSSEELIDFRNLAHLSMSRKTLIKNTIKSLLKIDLKQFKRIIKMLL